MLVNLAVADECCLTYQTSHSVLPHCGESAAHAAPQVPRDTDPFAAVKASPWTDMSRFSWRDARFAEYRTYGPGAQVTADRPQLSAGEAASFTVADYLRGTDGWAPYTRR